MLEIKTVGMKIFTVKTYLYLLNKLNKGNINQVLRFFFQYTSLTYTHTQPIPVFSKLLYFISSKSQEASIPDLAFKGINPRSEFNRTASYLRFLEWLPCEVAQIKPNLVIKKGYATNRNSEQWSFRLQCVLDFPLTWW